MVIEFKYDCGKAVTANEPHVGRRAKCPAFGAVLDHAEALGAQGLIRYPEALKVIAWSMSALGGAV